MRDIDAHLLEIAVTILEVTSDLHASRLEQHIAGSAGSATQVINAWITLRLNEAVGLMIANTIDGAGVEVMLGPLLDVFGDATGIWSDLGDEFRSRLQEIEKRALELIATGQSPF